MVKQVASRQAVQSLELQKYLKEQNPNIKILE
jgi:hypothetical protein